MDKKTAQQFKEWLEAERLEAGIRFDDLRAIGASSLQTYTPRVRVKDLDCCLAYLAEFMRQD